MLARFVAVGYLLYFVVLTPQLVGQVAWMPSWWTPMMIVVVGAPALALGLVSFRPGAGTVVASAVNALSFLIMPISWLLIDPGAVAGNTIGATVPWLAMMPGLPALAAPLVWQSWYVALYPIVACTSCQVVAHSARGWPDGTMFVLDTLFSIGFCGVFMGGAVMAIRTGRQLDRATVAARAHAAAAAEAQARQVERERFDALVHDGVLSTLLLASSTDGDTETLARQAGRTLAQIDRLRTGDGRQEPLSPADAIARLRAAATDVDENIACEVGYVEDARPVPVHVVRLIAAALGEAVRNSVRHASPSGVRVHRRLIVDVGADLLTVVVSDDGVGFDVKRVARHQMGIQVSILGRMRQLDGGTADVASRLDVGTTVTLTWTRLA